MVEAQAPRETAGVTTRVIIAYVRRHLGSAGVDRLLELAGETRAVADLEDERTWSTYAEKIALFAAAETLTGDEWVARRIGEHLLREQIAPPLRLLIGALGSPQRVLKSCALANVKFSTNSHMEALEARPGRAVVTYRVEEGYTPHRHDCRYTQGIITQATVLFGLPPATVREHTCQVAGDAVCRYEVTWSRWRRLTRWRRRERRASATSAEVVALREQVVDLQRTVADLVSTDDLDVVLARVADRASAAVRGQRYLLAVQLQGEATPRIHSDGLDADTAARLGRDLLCGTRAHLPDTEQLVAEVASARRRYGWLAAYLPRDKGFLPAEQSQLDAYARLAAAALDATTALAEARGRGEASEALLALASDLAHLKDPDAIAQRVAEAVPTVVGVERASLLRWNPQELHAEARAAHGYGPYTAAARTLQVPLGTTPVLDELLDDHRPRLLEAETADPFVLAAMERVGAVRVAIAPMAVHGRFLGIVLASWAGDTPPPVDAQALLQRLASIADQAAVALVNVELLDQARHQARHDSLTGLGNRVLLQERLEQALADGHRTGEGLAVCFLDLDRFKAVNDALGHAAGDELLVEVARRLRACVRETDVLARVSGDEFVLLLRHLDDVGHARHVADEVVAAVARPFLIAGTTVSVSASVGIALGPDHGASPDALLRAADAAMYEAKRTRGAAQLWEAPVLGTA